MKKYLAPLIIAFTASGALAQDLVPALAICAKDKSPTTRLTCFDALAAKHAAPVASTVTPPGSKWTVSTETSPIDDSKTVTLRVSADSSIHGWPRKTYTPALFIRCKERKTEAFVVTGMPPTVEHGNSGGATVTLRMDKAPAYKLNTTKSTDGEALFLPSATVQVKKLLEGSSLLFEFVPFNASPQMTTFQIAGLADAIKPLREACKW